MKTIYHKAFISIGSNLGLRIKNCIKAIEFLSDKEGITLKEISNFYETEPMHFQRQPWFINCVVRVETVMNYRDFFNFLKEIEFKMGRKKTFKYGPRLIDLDLLFFDDLVIDEDDLIVPHPQILNRKFVLMPLMDIAPDFIHPISGKSIKELLKKKEVSERIRKIKN